jgi:tetratricopeptide (TPR) repeat protein
MEKLLLSEIITLLNSEEYDQAIILLEQLITENPLEAINYWYLGLAFLLQGDELAAELVWLSFLDFIASEEADKGEQYLSELSLFLETETLLRAKNGKYLQAEKIHKQILKRKVEQDIAYHNLIVNLVKNKQLDDALMLINWVIKHEYHNFRFYSLLGEVLIAKGKTEQAVHYLHQAIAMNPEFAEAHKNLGNAYLRAGNLAEAQNCYERAIAIDSNYTAAYNNLGIIAEQLDQPIAAINYYRKALSLQPNYSAAHNNLGFALEEQGEIELALFHYNQAITVEPQYASAHFNRSLTLLRLGDFAEGFNEFEWRWQLRNSLPLSFNRPLWDGNELRESIILLSAEQGLGDTIQFIRYVHLVAARVKQVIVECQVSLIPLLKNITLINNLLPQGEPLPEFDIQAPLLSLPRIFKTTLDTIPAKTSYLQAPISSTNSLTIRLTSNLKVGLVWAGNPNQQNDRHRSCPIQLFSQLLEISNIDFYSLQKGPRAKELLTVTNSYIIQDLDEQMQNFADTAVLVSQLDLIITVDTAVAHLAGALGCPVWVVLCFMPDWRWMLEREDSPWYPTMRLFRQAQPGDWNGVLERVALALRGLVHQRSQP